MREREMSSYHEFNGINSIDVCTRSFIKNIGEFRSIVRLSNDG